MYNSGDLVLNLHVVIELKQLKIIEINCILLKNYAYAESWMVLKNSLSGKFTKNYSYVE